MAKFQSAEELISAFHAADPKNESINPGHYLIRMMDWLGIILVVHNKNSFVSQSFIKDGQVTIEINEKYYNYISWRNVSFAHGIAFACLSDVNANANANATETLITEEPYVTVFSGLSLNEEKFAFNLLFPFFKIKSLVIEDDVMNDEQQMILQFSYQFVAHSEYVKSKMPEIIKLIN